MNSRQIPRSDRMACRTAFPRILAGRDDASYADGRRTEVVCFFSPPLSLLLDDIDGNDDDDHLDTSFSTSELSRVMMVLRRSPTPSQRVYEFFQFTRDRNGSDLLARILGG